jgi:hypothetical protein
MISFLRSQVRADDVREPYILPRLDESRSALDSRVPPPPSAVFPILPSSVFLRVLCGKSFWFFPMAPGLFPAFIANKALPQSDPWVSLA